MNKTELIKAVAEHGIGYSQAEKAVNAVFSTVKASLAAGEKVSIKDFGVLETIEYPGRAGHNPRTGDKILIPAKRKVKFRAGKALEDALN